MQYLLDVADVAVPAPQGESHMMSRISDPWTMSTGTSTTVAVADSLLVLGRFRICGFRCLAYCHCSFERDHEVSAQDGVLLLRSNNNNVVLCFVFAGFANGSPLPVASVAAALQTERSVLFDV